MHPVIKVVSFLVVALFLTHAQLYGIAITLLALAAIHVAGFRLNLHSTWRMLRRMRWLFVSILVTYLWFTPGTPVIPLLGDYSPTTRGVSGGVLRITSLALIVVQVGLLLQSTSREELVGAIRWLAAPLRFAGLDIDRFALRMMLILDSVDEVQVLLQQQIAVFSTRKKSISLIADSVASLFQAVVIKADTTPPQRVVVAEQEWPPHYQWFYPVALTLLFGWGSYFNIY